MNMVLLEHILFQNKTKIISANYADIILSENNKTLTFIMEK